MLQLPRKQANQQIWKVVARQIQCTMDIQDQATMITLEQQVSSQNGAAAITTAEEVQQENLVHGFARQAPARLAHQALALARLAHQAHQALALPHQAMVAEPTTVAMVLGEHILIAKLVKPVMLAAAVIELHVLVIHTQIVRL